MVFYPQQLGVPDTPNQSSAQLSRCVPESFTANVKVEYHNIYYLLSSIYYYYFIDIIKLVMHQDLVT